MFRTAHKDPLAPGHSYPVGAEMLATSLGDVSTVVDLAIWFWRRSERMGGSHPGWNGRRHQGYPSSLRGYAPVLAVHLCRDRQDFPSDVIYVYSVMSSARAAIRQALRSRGLPVVREWLAAPRPPTWRHQRRYLQIGVDAPVTRLCAIESDHERVTNHQVVELAGRQPANQRVKPTAVVGGSLDEQTDRRGLRARR